VATFPTLLVIPMCTRSGATRCRPGLTKEAYLRLVGIVRGGARGLMVGSTDMADLRNVNPLPFEARSAGSVPRPVADAEAFRWGSRFVEVPNADGGTAFQEVPLRWEDLFDPQENDVMTHGTRHGILIREVAVMLQHWFESQGRSDVAVYDDVKMIWEDPAVAQVAPDVSVIPNVRDKERNRPSFRVAEEGTRPCLMLEFVSPDYAKFDLEDKPPSYRQVGGFAVHQPRRRGGGVVVADVVVGVGDAGKASCAGRGG